jgi:hypothetical protein
VVGFSLIVVCILLGGGSFFGSNLSFSMVRVSLIYPGSELILSRVPRAKLISFLGFTFGISCVFAFRSLMMMGCCGGGIRGFSLSSSLLGSDLSFGVMRLTFVVLRSFCGGCFLGCYLSFGMVTSLDGGYKLDPSAG